MSGQLLVLQPGAQTIVVDRGRFGARHLGVPWCGAADRAAYDAGNDLLGNDENAAALEITFGSAAFAFEQETAFALTGADANAQLDGEPLVPWRAYTAFARMHLRFARPARGLRTYLAVAGGIDVPSVMGSRSTDLFAGFGGFEGRALRRGDVVRIDSPIPGRERTATPQPATDGIVRVLPCGEFAGLEAESQRALFATAWSVQPESSRMGYRLRGASLRYRGAEIASRAVFPGFIQVPPAGDPIVLLADAPATGGYPTAGIVCDPDLRRIAQARPGDILRFVEAR